MRQVEEALARQVIYGGDLVTNLLEVTRVDETVLTPLLAESMQLEAAGPGELAPPSDAVRALIPAEIAVQHSIVPLESDAVRLVLAVVDPLPASVREQLAFALGMRVDERAAPAVRVWQAIARTYGVQLDRRMHRLISRLSGGALAQGSLPPLAAPPHDATRAGEAPKGGADPNPAEPPAISAGSRPSARSTSVRPVGALASSSTARRSTLTSFPALLAPQPPPVDADAHALLQSDAHAQHRAARRRRGPLTLEAARAEADDATHRDLLLDLFFDFSRQFFDYAVLFLVQSDIAEGRDTFGSGASRERVLGIGVPLDLPSLLATARETRAPVIATPAEGLDAVLLADLQRPPGSEIVVIPLLVRTRAVALFVGDCGDAGIDGDSVRQVFGFGGVIGKAFERIIVRRKLDGFIAGSRASGTGHVDPVAVPSKNEVPASVAPPPPRAQSQPAFPAVSTRPVSVEASDLPTFPSSTPPPSVNIAALRPIGGPPIPREEPDAPPAPAVDSVAVVGVRDSGSTRRGPTGVARDERAYAESAHGEGANGVTPPAPAASLSDPTELFDAFAREIVTLDGDGAHGIPSSAVAVPAHRPPAAQPGGDHGLPLVIVDIAAELGALVDRLIAGNDDESAEVELLRQGVRAMPAIMARFPGPVVFDRARIATMPSPPRASECGVVLRLVARERKVALPFVLQCLHDSNPERRGWATHVLGELPYLDALAPLIERLNDDDAATRVSAALSIAAIGRSHPGRVVQTLRELADDTDPRQRLAAMRAAGEVRDSRLVPLLTEALSDGAEEVAAAAHHALVTLTRQDLGLDPRLWSRWWEQNSSRHRIEWLIDALTHDSPEIRRTAGDELRLLSRQYFGFSSDLPGRERERAQQRYRDWWITEGRAIHRRS